MAGGDIVFIHPDFEDLPDSLKAAMFDPTSLDEAGLLIKILRGRGNTYFFKLRQDGCVLRHYWRGGALRHLSKDGYFWLGLSHSRSYREWRILEKLERLELPAPRRVALRIQRKGLLYSSDIVTKEIKNSLALSDTLKVQELDGATWKLIGQTIRRFHDKQVFHQDLNAGNILLTKHYCFLIDFDRGRIQSGDWWKKGTLERLKRSLNKFKTNEQKFHFDKSVWAALLDGYQASV